MLTERLIKRRESAGADLARMTMTLSALIEGNDVCWRGEDCELCTGVQGGLKTLSGHTRVASDLADQRVSPFPLSPHSLFLSSHLRF